MALEAVKQVLDIIGGREPVYTPWEPVHNRPVMEALAKRGLVNFELDWNSVPDGAVVLFPAHGAPPSFHQLAHCRRFLVIDVTCKLVHNVYDSARQAEQNGHHILYIGGRKDHPEAVGVIGQVNPENITLITTPDDVDRLPDIDRPIVALCQTTLSTKGIGEIAQRLRNRFPAIKAQGRLNICYATDNRQAALDEMLPFVDALVVVGSTNISHNSSELLKKALAHQIPGYSLDTPDQFQATWLEDVTRLGLTSGASVPEGLLNAVLGHIISFNPTARVKEWPQVRPEKLTTTFKLPQEQIDTLRARYR